MFREAHRRHVTRRGRVHPWPSSKRDARWQSFDHLNGVRSNDWITRREHYLELPEPRNSYQFTQLPQYVWRLHEPDLVYAINALAKIASRATVPLLLELSIHRTGPARAAALAAVERYGDESLAFYLAWIEVYRSGNHLFDPSAFAEFTGEFRPALQQLARAPHANVRRGALTALSNLADIRSLEIMRQARLDSSSTVREAARTSLDYLNAEHDASATIRPVTVFSDGVFQEVGAPIKIVHHPTRNKFAVISWQGCADSYSQQSKTLGYAARVAIYDASSLNCLATMDVDEVKDIAFHPSEDVVAVGTGGWDGGYTYRGRLLIWNLATGRPIDIFRRQRRQGPAHAPQISNLEFNDSGHNLQILSTSNTYEDKYPSGSQTRIRTLTAENWSSLRDGAFEWSHSETEQVETFEEVSQPTDFSLIAHAAAELAEISNRVGLPYSPSWDTWDIAWIANDQIISSRSGVGIEIWNMSGERDHHFPIQGDPANVAYFGDASPQIIVRTKDREKVFDSQILLIDGASGMQTSIDLLKRDCTFTAVGDSGLLARELDDNYMEPLRLCWIDRSGSSNWRTYEEILLDRVSVLGHDGKTYAYLGLRLKFDDIDGKPSSGFWIARVHAETLDLELLFPVAMPVVYSIGSHFSDSAGAGLILATEEGVIQRITLDGPDPVWKRLVRAPIHAIDVLVEHGVVVFAGNKHIGLLDLNNGKLIDYQPVTIDGFSTDITRIATRGDRIACGTIDGRIIVYEITPVVDRTDPVCAGDILAQ